MRGPLLLLWFVLLGNRAILGRGSSLELGGALSTTTLIEGGITAFVCAAVALIVLARFTRRELGPFPPPIRPCAGSAPSGSTRSRPPFGARW